VALGQNKQTLAGVELEEAAQQLLGADDDINNDSKLDEVLAQAGAFTDARLTRLIAEQACDTVCKQVAADLEKQPRSPSRPWSCLFG
jgi:hypothetical protein